MDGIHTLEIKVVGVTFDNSDGTSRQRILGVLSSEPWLHGALQRYVYDGGPAYRVICNGMQIGNVPSALAFELAEAEDDGCEITVKDVSVYGGPDESFPDKSYGAAIHISIEQPAETATACRPEQNTSRQRTAGYQRKRGLTKEEYDRAAAAPRFVRKWVLIIAGCAIAALLVYYGIMDIITAIILHY